MTKLRNRVFITSTLAPEVVENYKLSVATSYFSFNLASGGAFNTVFSILPDTFQGILDDKIIQDKRYEVIYCQELRKCGRFFRVLAVFIEQIRLFFRIPRKSSVWFYNLGDLGSLVFILIKLFKPSVLLNVIVLDYTPPISFIDRKKFYIRLINKADGIITLSVSEIFKKENKAILPGVVPYKKPNAPRIIKVNNRFILSGVLSEVIAQTNMVLEAFSQLPECELHITGFIHDDTIIKQYSQKYQNIIYHGKVQYHDYLDILHSCSFQLSTRDENALENMCNFPSKIMEALLHNRIVVSTINYPQLGEIKCLKVESGVESFKKSITTIMNMSNEVLISYANQSERVQLLFSPDVWRDKMGEIENNTQPL